MKIISKLALQSVIILYGKCSASSVFMIAIACITQLAIDSEGFYFIIFSFFSLQFHRKINGKSIKNLNLYLEMSISFHISNKSVK